MSDHVILDYMSAGFGSWHSVQNWLYAPKSIMYLHAQTSDIVSDGELKQNTRSPQIATTNCSKISVRQETKLRLLPCDINRCKYTGILVDDLGNALNIAGSNHCWWYWPNCGHNGALTQPWVCVLDEWGLHRTEHSVHGYVMWIGTPVQHWQVYISTT